METVLDKQCRQLQLVNELTLALNQAQSLVEIYQVVLGQIQSILQIDQVRIALYCAETSLLEIVASRANPSTSNAYLPSIALREECIATNCLTYEQGVCIAGANVEATEPLDSPHSIVCAPLVARAKPFGLLQVECAQADAYDPYDLQLLQQIALQVANVIARQRFFDESNDRAIDAEEKAIYFESMLYNIPTALFVKDAKELRFVYVNPAFSGMIDSPHKDIIGKSDYDLFPAAQADFFVGKDREALRNGEVVDIPEEAITNADGDLRYLHTIKVPVCDQNGEPLFLLGISEDITEKRQAQDALKFANIVVENSPVVLFRWRAEAGLPIDYVSHNVEQFGYSADRLVSTNTAFASLIYPEDTGWATKDVLELVQSSVRELSRTFRLVTQEGAVRWVEAKIQIERQNESEVTHFQGVLIDVTEQKQSEELLRQAKDNAEAANHTKSLFLSNMTHELRTPMNGVLGMASILGETALADEQQEMLDVICSSGDTLLTIINDILDISKVEANKLELELVPFRIRTCIEETFNIVQPSTLGKEIDLTFDIDKNVPQEVIQDVTRVRQILTNLVGNAIKFTEQGSVSVTVKASQSQSDTDTCMKQIHFTIADTGVGIPPDRIDALFDAFSQADASTTRRYGGTGLGLPISKHLCAMMGGSMWVESEAGKGSIFNFTIIAEKAPYAEETKPQVAHAHRVSAYDPTLANKHPLRILLAEDNVVNQKVALGMLKNLGYTADVAANGLEVIDALNRQPYDVVLMDIHMPEMDGLEATRYIQKQWSEKERVAIIAVTASVLMREKASYLAAGMDGFISKPIRINELIDALKSVQPESSKVDHVLEK